MAKPAHSATWGSALSRRLQRSWQRADWLSYLLWPISFLLGRLVRLRQALFAWGLLRSEHPGAVTVVVGNVVAGGAGKTPVVIALVEHWQAQGLAVGVISRGHGRQGQGCREVGSESLAQEVGDEPLLIRRRTQAPVFVARRRPEAARALLRAYPETRIIVCDDGLQHLALQRDLEVCVFDDRGVGNGFLQPAGPLREPWPRRVDLVLHSGQHPAFDTGYRCERRLGPAARNGLGQTLRLETLKGQAVQAVAGIAWPERFFEMLRQQGLELVHVEALPDHHDFADWSPAAAPELPLLCTEKDAAKLWLRQPQAWAVPLECLPEPGFWRDLDQRLAAALSSLPFASSHPGSTTHGQQTS